MMYLFYFLIFFYMKVFYNEIIILYSKSYQTSNQSRIPAEFKHITKRRKRN